MKPLQVLDGTLLRGRLIDGVVAAEAASGTAMVTSSGAIPAVAVTYWGSAAAVVGGGTVPGNKMEGFPTNVRKTSLL